MDTDAEVLDADLHDTPPESTQTTSTAATTAGAQMLPENRHTHDDTASDLDLVDGGWIVPAHPAPTQPTNPGSSHEAETGMVNEENDATNYGKVI